jgi:hypothetical protein
MWKILKKWGRRLFPLAFKERRCKTRFVGVSTKKLGEGTGKKWVAELFFLELFLKLSTDTRQRSYIL